MTIESLLRDSRLGVRILRREKSFCLIAVAILALGIGGVTTLFSVVNGVLLRGFSFPHAERLMSIQFVDTTQADPSGFLNQIHQLDFEQIREHQQAFDLVAAYIDGSTVNLTIDGVPQRRSGTYVTHEFLDTIGVAPARGRNFTADDDRPGAAAVALIGDGLWRSDFGGAPDIVGKQVRLNGKPATIIGVMPPGFSFPAGDQLWVPLFAEFPPSSRTAARAVPDVLGRLRAGASADQAAAELTLLARRLAREFPETNKRFDTARVVPLLEAFTPRNVRQLLWTMLACCAGILLLACVNVMNMQLARAALRVRELTIRSSLGATRGRLVRQMLTESLVLAALGAGCGIVLAAWGADFFESAAHNLSNPVPPWMVFELDGRVLAFVVAITALSALVSGLLPAWLASRANAADALKDAARGHTSRALTVVTGHVVVFEVLVTAFLLVASLLQLQSIRRQERIDWGYDTSAVLSARLGLMEGDYPTPASRQPFYDRLLRGLRASPEFSAAAFTSRFRMTFVRNLPTTIELEGRAYAHERDRHPAVVENVSDGCFAALGQRLLAGRDFHAEENDTRQPVAIINEHVARKYFGAENPLGRRFRIVDLNGRLFGPWRTIVGVVSDVRMVGPFPAPGFDDSGVYLPLGAALVGPAAPPEPPQFATIVVRPRAGVPPAAAIAALRRETTRADPHLPLYFVGTARENQESFLSQNRIIATLFSGVGLVAVVLAAAGLYGVLSFAVNQRTHEIGIRMALGADARRILRLVLRQGALQLAVGVSLGLGLALLVGRLAAEPLRNLLFEVEPTEPAVYLGVAALLWTVGLAAALAPARRATRVDPIVALRAE